MKVCTVLGTRPEIIRLSRIIPLLDQCCEHVLVHTGQNHDERLDRIFFEELRIRDPDVRMAVGAHGFGAQVGQILTRIEVVLRQERPDRVLILGDTNSGLSALVARRMGIPVFHMEAGNRCFDDRVPEEINRRVIDHTSTVLLPYTERSRANLLREGIAPDRIYVTGNPIWQVMEHYRDDRAIACRPGCFFLATLHRAETVDDRAKLAGVLSAFESLHDMHGFPVVCSLHPRTRDRAAAFGLETTRPGVHFVEPYGFFDFMAMERSAACILTDSGTVQEEACIIGVPSVILRDATERPEAIECGAGVMAGTDPDAICAAVWTALALGRDWTPPPEYLRTGVAETVCRIVTGGIA